ncbi:hypothetical protein [Clostridium botulinum]|uniref:hypothetical protein n=1 Tax=Clostridium botulinum TaxID=1491 RepID=UPI001FA6ECEA|nr:hypothetical protein [Clostridium botulinum]
MKNLKACYYELEGTNYEVGKLLGEKMKAMPQLLEMQKMQKSPFSKEEQIQIIKMFDEYCPGINEGIQDFTDVLGLDKFQAIYYAMSFLKPGCSEMAILPQKTKNNHVLLARNMNLTMRWKNLFYVLLKLKENMLI